MSEKALASLRLAVPDGKHFPATAYYQQLQADVWFEAGRAYQIGRRIAQAIEAYSRSLEYDAKRVETHRQLAELYSKKGDQIRAREHAAAAEK